MAEMPEATTEQIRNALGAWKNPQGYSWQDVFDRWLSAHNEGQRIKGVQGLLDFRPLPRDVRRYIESYLEAGADEAGLARTDSRP